MKVENNSLSPTNQPGVYEKIIFFQSSSLLGFLYLDSCAFFSYFNLKGSDYSEKNPENTVG